MKGKPFDLYSDERSQVYLGVAGEKTSTTKAVTDTAGEVVLYGGKVATTYYFSSSGGKTASAADVFGFSVPYLVSRPDPWDKASPYYRWGPVLLGARTVQAKLSVDARVVDLTGTATPSGRLRSLAVETTSGSETVPASLVRTALGLRSTWLTISVLRLDRPSSSGVVFGSIARLGGISRGVTEARIASSPDGTAWAPAGNVSPDSSGAISVDIKPVRTTRYRLEAEGGASPALLVRVSPRLQLTPPTSLDPTTLRGTVRPRLLGAVVAVERRKGTSWVTLGETTVDASGAFALELAAVVPAGVYRARISATSGFAAGTSPVLQVS